MACEVEQQNIAGVNYGVTQWSAEKALIMKFKLIKAFGASVTSFLKTDIDDTAKITNALESLFNSITPEDAVVLIKSCIVNNVRAEGKLLQEVDFNTYFAGDKLINIYKVFIFVIRVNYKNFFNGQLGGILTEATQEK